MFMMVGHQSLGLHLLNQHAGQQEPAVVCYVVFLLVQQQQLVEERMVAMTMWL
jgi:hypothetical protein